MLPTTDENLSTIVLDTSAFIAGFEPLSINDDQYSVPEVGKELLGNSLSRSRFNAAVESGRLTVRSPKELYVGRIKTHSEALGDLLYLSSADLQVLALALELKDAGCNPQIVTDDFSMQNVANRLEIGFVPLMTFGIRYRFRWTLYCPACHHRYPSDRKGRSCDVCGTMLKRKPIKKTPIGQQE